MFLKGRHGGLLLKQETKPRRKTKTKTQSITVTTSPGTQESPPTLEVFKTQLDRLLDHFIQAPFPTKGIKRTHILPFRPSIDVIYSTASVLTRKRQLLLRGLHKVTAQYYKA